MFPILLSYFLAAAGSQLCSIVQLSLENAAMVPASTSLASLGTTADVNSSAL